MKKALNKYSWEILFFIPFALYLFGLTIFPILNSLYLSFFDATGSVFPSFGSYQQILGHFQFKQALFNTLFVVVVGLALEMGLGLVLALILLEKFRGRGLLRALMLLPLGVPTIVVASNMRYIFDTNGFLNELLFRLGLASLPIDWLGGGVQTLFSIVTADMWKVTPLVMLILLAGLESIPTEIIEAALMDGAGYFRRLFKVYLPLLTPYITMALIVRGIDAFRIFELPLALTGRTTPVLATYSFFEYRNYGNVHTAAAAATILMLLILISMLFYLLAVRQREGIE